MRTEEKRCRSCKQIKSSVDFYTHPHTADGLQADCKECHKKSVRDYRTANLEKCKAYDRQRATLPHRMEARAKYAATSAGKKSTVEAKKRWAQQNTNRRAVHILFGNAVRSGRVIKMPCEICGSTIRIHGHHDDYMKPLDVRWLCPAHHSDWHKMLRGH